MATSDQPHPEPSDEPSLFDGSTERRVDPEDVGDPPSARRERRGKKPRSRLAKALIAALVFLLVIAGVLAGVGIYLINKVGGGFDRVDDVFDAIPEDQRPAASTPETGGGDPVTYLLVGSDTRADITAGELPDARSDVLMMIRFTADRQHAQIISIPRDSWVPIPGHGTSKINAAYSYGGPTLLVETVEQLTQVRIDHYVAFDFQGFQTITDALGGVDVDVAQTVTSRGTTFTAGRNHLDGATALIYVRERYELPGGDFDRVKRQQQVIQSLFRKLRSEKTFGDLGTLTSTLNAVTSAMAIDDTLGNTELVEFAWSLRNLTEAGTTFLTAPVSGTGMEGAQSVVYLDPGRANTMWKYLRSDSLTDHIGEFSANVLPEVPN